MTPVLGGVWRVFRRSARARERGVQRASAGAAQAEGRVT